VRRSRSNADAVCVPGPEVGAAIIRNVGIPLIELVKRDAEVLRDGPTAFSIDNRVVGIAVWCNVWEGLAVRRSVLGSSGWCQQ
jgi:hypothetical protein